MTVQRGLQTDFDSTRNGYNDDRNNKTQLYMLTLKSRPALSMMFSAVGFHSI